VFSGGEPDQMPLDVVGEHVVAWRARPSVAGPSMDEAGVKATDDALVKDGCKTGHPRRSCPSAKVVTKSNV
jgi:hypothetical protein